MTSDPGSSHSGDAAMSAPGSRPRQKDPFTAHRTKAIGPAGEVALCGLRGRNVRDLVADRLQTLPLPCRRARLVDLEHPDALGEVGVSLDERVEARAQEDVLADALLDD